jgi:hypothetical protein
MYFMGKNSKHQHPSSREIPSTKIQRRSVLQKFLELEGWSFSGAWSLDVGASF